MRKQQQQGKKVQGEMSKSLIFPKGDKNTLLQHNRSFLLVHESGLGVVWPPIKKHSTSALRRRPEEAIVDVVATNSAQSSIRVVMNLVTSLLLWKNTSHLSDILVNNQHMSLNQALDECLSIVHILYRVDEQGMRIVTGITLLTWKEYCSLTPNIMYFQSLSNSQSVTSLGAMIPDKEGGIRTPLNCLLSTSMSRPAWFESCLQHVNVKVYTYATLNAPVNLDRLKEELVNCLVALSTRLDTHVFKLACVKTVSTTADEAGETVFTVVIIGTQSTHVFRASELDVVFSFPKVADSNVMFTDEANNPTISRSTSVEDSLTCQVFPMIASRQTDRTDASTMMLEARERSSAMASHSFRCPPIYCTNDGDTALVVFLDAVKNIGRYLQLKNNSILVPISSSLRDYHTAIKASRHDPNVLVAYFPQDAVDLEDRSQQRFLPLLTNVDLDEVEVLQNLLNQAANTPEYALINAVRTCIKHVAYVVEADQHSLSSIDVTVMTMPGGRDGITTYQVFSCLEPSSDLSVAAADVDATQRIENNRCHIQGELVKKLIDYSAV